MPTKAQQILNQILQEQLEHERDYEMMHRPQRVITKISIMNIIKEFKETNFFPELLNEIHVDGKYIKDIIDITLTNNSLFFDFNDNLTSKRIYLTDLNINDNGATLICGRILRNGLNEQKNINLTNLEVKNKKYIKLLKFTDYITIEDSNTRSIFPKEQLEYLIKLDINELCHNQIIVNPPRTQYSNHSGSYFINDIKNTENADTIAKLLSVPNEGPIKDIKFLQIFENSLIITDKFKNTYKYSQNPNENYITLTINKIGSGTKTKFYSKQDNPELFDNLNKFSLFFIKNNNDPSGKTAVIKGTITGTDNSSIYPIEEANLINFINNELPDLIKKPTPLLNKYSLNNENDEKVSYNLTNWYDSLANDNPYKSLNKYKNALVKSFKLYKNLIEITLTNGHILKYFKRPDNTFFLEDYDSSNGDTIFTTKLEERFNNDLKSLSGLYNTLEVDGSNGIKAGVYYYFGKLFKSSLPAKYTKRYNRRTKALTADGVTISTEKINSVLNTNLEMNNNPNCGSFLELFRQNNNQTGIQVNNNTESNSRSTPNNNPINNGNITANQNEGNTQDYNNPNCGSMLEFIVGANNLQNIPNISQSYNNINNSHIDPISNNTAPSFRSISKEPEVKKINPAIYNNTNNINFNNGNNTKSIAIDSKKKIIIDNTDIKMNKENQYIEKSEDILRHVFGGKSNETWKSNIVDTNKATNLPDKNLVNNNLYSELKINNINQNLKENIYTNNNKQNDLLPKLPILTDTNNRGNESFISNQKSNTKNPNTNTSNYIQPVYSNNNMHKIENKDFNYIDPSKNNRFITVKSPQNSDVLEESDIIIGDFNNISKQNNTDKNQLFTKVEKLNESKIIKEPISNNQFTNQNSVVNKIVPHSTSSLRYNPTKKNDFIGNYSMRGNNNLPQTPFVARNFEN